jgi:hypothetical protein
LDEKTVTVLLLGYIDPSHLRMDELLQIRWKSVGAVLPMPAPHPSPRKGTVTVEGRGGRREAGRGKRDPFFEDRNNPSIQGFDERNGRGGP